MVMQEWLRAREDRVDDDAEMDVDAPSLHMRIGGDRAGVVFSLDDNAGYIPYATKGGAFVPLSQSAPAHDHISSVRRSVVLSGSAIAGGLKSVSGLGSSEDDAKHCLDEKESASEAGSKGRLSSMLSVSLSRGTPRRFSVSSNASVDVAGDDGDEGSIPNATGTAALSSLSRSPPALALSNGQLSHSSLSPHSSSSSFSRLGSLLMASSGSNLSPFATAPSLSHRHTQPLSQLDQKQAKPHRRSHCPSSFPFGSLSSSALPPATAINDRAPRAASPFGVSATVSWADDIISRPPLAAGGSPTAMPYRGRSGSSSDASAKSGGADLLPSRARSGSDASRRLGRPGVDSESQPSNSRAGSETDPRNRRYSRSRVAVASGDQSSTSDLASPHLLPQLQETRGDLDAEADAEHRLQSVLSEQVLALL